MRLEKRKRRRMRRRSRAEMVHGRSLRAFLMERRTRRSLKTRKRRGTRVGR